LKQAEDRLNSTSTKLTARKPYFFGILRNITVGGNEIDQQKLDAEVRQEIAQKTAEDRHMRAQEGFEDHRRKVFRDWVHQLDDDRKHALLKACQESKQGNAILISTVTKGLHEQSKSALSILRGWIETTMPDMMAEVFVNPEDKSLEAWMAWKLEGVDVVNT